MSNETIEQKTCRLAIEVRPQLKDYRNQITLATFYYKQVEKMIELAIAEEREANIRICERIYFEANAPLSKDALNCAIAIRGRIAAPKAEVSE